MISKSLFKSLILKCNGTVVVGTNVVWFSGRLISICEDWFCEPGGWHLLLGDLLVRGCSSGCRIILFKSRCDMRAGEADTEAVVKY